MREPVPARAAHSPNSRSALALETTDPLSGPAAVLGWADAHTLWFVGGRKLQTCGSRLKYRLASNRSQSVPQTRHLKCPRTPSLRARARSPKSAPCGSTVVGLPSKALQSAQDIGFISCTSRRSSHAAAAAEGTVFGEIISVAIKRIFNGESRRSSHFRQSPRSQSGKTSRIAAWDFSSCRDVSEPDANFPFWEQRPARGVPRRPHALGRRAGAMCGARCLADASQACAACGASSRVVRFSTTKQRRLASMRGVPAENLKGSVASGVLATRFFATD